MATFLVGRLFATYCMAAGFQYTVAKNLKLGDITIISLSHQVELMPTCLRGRGVALVNLMSMVAMVAAPYIVYSVSSGQDVAGRF